MEELDETFLTYEKLDSITYGNIDIESYIIYLETLKEFKEILKKAQLTKNQEYAIIHKIILEEKHDDIARKLDITEPRVSQILRQALNNLRKQIKYFEDLGKYKDSIRVNVRG
ncbi:MAG: sigma-70 family RNA polymerase sigma factor [Bacilli bacterium]|nr:sigma-70 family RNA polymerase sigma factor [Bacilli bacterium]